MTQFAVRSKSLASWDLAQLCMGPLQRGFSRSFHVLLSNRLDSGEGHGQSFNASGKIRFTYEEVVVCAIVVIVQRVEKKQSE